MSTRKLPPGWQPSREGWARESGLERWIVRSAFGGFQTFADLDCVGVMPISETIYSTPKKAMEAVNEWVANRR